MAEPNDNQWTPKTDLIREDSHRGLRETIHHPAFWYGV